MKDPRAPSHEVTRGRGDRAADDRAGDRIGAETLFRAHAPFVAAFVKRLGVPAVEVDDLVQEVFLVAHRKGGYEPGPAQPRSWLGAIAVRLVRSRHRSAGRRRERPDHDALETAACTTQSPARRYEVRESLARVQRALDGLDLDHRAAFVLYELEGESCQAIAASFDVPTGTVYSRLHHARRRFAQAHAELLAQDQPVAGPPASSSIVEGRGR